MTAAMTVVTVTVARSDVDVQTRNPNALAMTMTTMPMATAAPSHFRDFAVKLRSCCCGRSCNATHRCGAGGAGKRESASGNGCRNQTVTKFHQYCSP